MKPPASREKMYFVRPGMPWRFTFLEDVDEGFAGSKIELGADTCVAIVVETLAVSSASEGSVVE
jgi:hypothetical protein